MLLSLIITQSRKLQILNIVQSTKIYTRQMYLVKYSLDLIGMIL